MPSFNSLQYIFVTTNPPRMIRTSNEMEENKILENQYPCDVKEQANFCDVIITQTCIFQHSCFRFFLIPHLMITAQQKIFCVFQFGKTEFVVSVQQAFQWNFSITAPSAKNIRRWHKQFEGTSCMYAKERAHGDQGLQKRQF